METEAFEPRRSLTQTITEEITAWIKSGRYKPGDHLPAEGELARLFKVSKPSVRESLKHLVAVGAVEISHGKPATVREMNAVPLINFFHLAVAAGETGLREAVELRRGLEIESALLATERATPEDIAELGCLIELLDQHKSDPAQWVPAHVAFHTALVRAAHNRFYSFLQDALKETLDRTNREILKVNPMRDPQVAFERHLELFKAIKSGKRANTRKAIESHFDAIDAVLKAPLAK